MKKWILALCLCILPFAFTGCSSGNTDGSTQQPENVAGQQEQEEQTDENRKQETISIIGSTTIQPVVQSIADQFQKENTNINIEIQGVGSSAGIKAAMDGTAEIGASSRELKEEEKASGLTEHILAYDGIAVVVNQANTVESLDMETVNKIFSGEIVNWSEVGGSDNEIIVISRESGSGTRDAFEEMAKLQKEINGKKVSSLKREALIAEGNGAVKASVASKENSIAYLSLGYVDDTMKTIQIDHVKPTVETVKSGEYPISRPLILLTKEEPSSGVQSFLDYCMGEKGQEVVSENYIPIQ